jgi:hypothetical protein
LRFDARWIFQRERSLVITQRQSQWPAAAVSQRPCDFVYLPQGI